MLDHSPANWIAIRTSILLLQHAPLIELVILTTIVVTRTIGLLPLSRITYLSWTYGLAFLVVSELVFYIFLYRRHLHRIKDDAEHPAPLTRTQREELFETCMVNIPDAEEYLRQWFLGAPLGDIGRDNVREFILWAFFDRHDATDGKRPIQGPGPEDGDVTDELESYIAHAVEQKRRSLLWYVIVAGIDLTTHICLTRDGYRYYGQPLRKTLAVFPLRFQAVTTLLPFPGARRYQSPSGEMGYWFRPHTAKNTRPVVFLHGIGVGLWPYTRFLDEIGRPTKTKTGSREADEGQIGVIALEILPISTRLTAPPMRREAFLSALQAILSAHARDWGDDGFVLVSHSYGSVLTTHAVRSPELGPQIRGMVLIDPVSLLLHLPGVAYNFTRRPPRTANEWQLWFFASMDVGVAEGLGRHFFWRENEVWKEELVGQGSGALENGKRKVAVCLGGRDLIVDTHTVAKYLARRGDIRKSDKPEEDAVEALYGRRPRKALVTPKRQQCKKYLAPLGIEILWFPALDHAQVFDSQEDREQVLAVIRDYCTK
ncbi:hypothetical protein DL546_002530 [Coniochaeta pulveracea]|uniref:AB hydrolase-1 domain-containing protein n=1 Tax=Coniochaeta pulveracea TaxID=177199 RepID=A0A420Y091_9PEZI|nr:hypothetical protein DL546_002530 [Coniochaeta pulveracea]